MINYDIMGGRHPNYPHPRTGQRGGHSGGGRGGGGHGGGHGGGGFHGGGGRSFGNGTVVKSPIYYGGLGGLGYGYPYGYGYGGYYGYPGYAYPSYGLDFYQPYFGGAGVREAYVAWQSAANAGASPQVVADLKAKLDALIYGAGSGYGAYGYGAIPAGYGYPTYVY